MSLTCPKCQGDMRTYERNGVHVDQCTECRGIFLDRGELEKLIDAEASYHDEPATSAPPPGAPAGPSAPAAASGLGALVGEVLREAKAASSSGGHDRGYGDRGSSQGYDPRYGKPRKKKSLIGELFG